MTHYLFYKIKKRTITLGRKIKTQYYKIKSETRRAGLPLKKKKLKNGCGKFPFCLFIRSACSLAAGENARPSRDAVELAGSL